MGNAFIIVLREGFEAFLIVAVATAYLRKAGLLWLMSSVWWGVIASVFVSAGLGWLIYINMNEALWEGVLGLIASILILTLVIHMWIHGPRLKAEMEAKLQKLSSQTSRRAVQFGVFFFIMFMISREGMETALLLIQIHEPNIVTGAVLGLLAAGAFSALWIVFSRFINVKLFFQVTGVFLILFTLQLIIYSLHELSEAHMLPNSESFHLATEAFSPDGLYGKWFSVVSVSICGIWILVSSVTGIFKSKNSNSIGNSNRK